MAPTEEYKIITTTVIQSTTDTLQLFEGEQRHTLVLTLLHGTILENTLARLNDAGIVPDETAKEYINDVITNKVRQDLASYPHTQAAINRGTELVTQVSNLATSILSSAQQTAAAHQ